MTFHAATSAAYSLPADEIAVSSSGLHRISNLRSSPNHNEGDQMSVSLRDSSNFNRGERTDNTRSSTADCAAWLASFFRATPAKIIANDAGINLRAAENVKQGRNGLTMAHIENLCHSNPTFRAAWFAERCGGFLEGEPETVAALTRAINAIMRAGK